MHVTFFSTPIINHLLRFIAWVFLKVVGWKCFGTVPKEPKYIILAGPHTSTWDFPLMMAAAFTLRLIPYWMGKDTLFTNPLGWFFKWMGGIPIDRSKSSGVVDQMVTLFNEADELSVGISPEGTRKAISKWKSGFYYIALQAKIPLTLAYLDFEKKECNIGELYWLTGDYDVDMKYIQEFYATKPARHPEKFAGEFLE